MKALVTGASGFIGSFLLNQFKDNNEISFRPVFRNGNHLVTKKKILIENIEKLGKVGDVVKVKDGYARNYLIPKKKVLRASKENLKVFEEKKSEIEAEEKKRKDS